MKHTLSFIEGMDKDTDVHKYPNTRFSHAENLRFIYEQEHSMGILTNEVGNSLKIQFGGTLLGWTTLRDTLVLFISEDEITYIAQIPQPDETSRSINLSSDDIEYTKLAKNFGNTQATQIKAIGRYESNNLQKIYWIDEVSLKFANLADRDIQDYDISKFEAFPQFTVGNLSTELMQGNLQSGRVQYTYQLFNVNGASTVFGPLSPMVNITSSSQSETTDKFRGSDVGENTNKGVLVQVDEVEESYDRIRLYRIHYSDINQEPEVFLIDEKNVTGNIEIFSDVTSTGLGQIDFAQFIATRADIVPETIETKNNILFQGNTTEKVFDVEYNTDNVTWEFVTDEVLIDSNPADSNSDNNIFKHSAPSSQIKVKGSFQRDEIYRFGIVLYDKKFQPSFVKPIADIIIEDDDIVSSNLFSVNARYKRIKFTINDLPDSVQAYQIVYVKRDREKRSVLDTGIVHRMRNTQFYGGGSFVPTPVKYLEYTSAEYLYGNLQEAGSSLDILAKTNLRNRGRLASNLGTATHKKLVQERNPIGNYQINKAYYHKGVDDLGLVISAGDSLFDNVVEFGSSKGTKGSCIILEINESDFLGINLLNSFYYVRRRKSLGGSVGRDVRNNSNFYGPLEGNTFIPCSEVQNRDNSTVTAYGDVFINFMEFIRVLYPLAEEGIDRCMRSIAVPVETTINLNYISNPTITSLVNLPYSLLSPRHYIMQEQRGYHIRGSEFEYNQPFDLYTYNSVYSRQEDIKPHVVRPETLREDTKIDTRVYHSERKINAELEDGWLVSRQFLDVDTAYGGITRLYAFKNNLFFFQSKGIGILSVDQRELTNTESISALTLGVGGILDRYDYITTESGTEFYHSITSSKAGIYYVDNKNKTLNRLGELPEALSDIYSIKSFTSNADMSNAKTVFNARYNSIIYFIDNKALEFNESIGKFTGFFTLNPDNVISIEDRVLTTTGNKSYLFDDIKNNGQFDDITNESKIVFIIKTEGRTIDRLDVLELLTYVLQDNEETAETFSKFRIYNSYQDTGYVDITEDVAVRRMRNWRINMLRDAKNEGRLKDSYFYLELVFNNESNKTIKLSDVVIDYFPVRPY